MKLAVVGGRDFNNIALLEQTLNQYKDKITLVISGGAKGADTLAEQWAKSNNIIVKVFKPDWEKYGRSAGPRRNKLIIQECEECIAFWDGKSTGTANSIFICKKLNKKVDIIRYENIN